MAQTWDEGPRTLNTDASEPEKDRSFKHATFSKDDLAKSSVKSNSQEHPLVSRENTTAKAGTAETYTLRQKTTH